MRKTVAILLVLICAALVLALQTGTGSAGGTEAVEKAVLEAYARTNQAEKGRDVDAFFAFILESDKGPIIQDGRLFKTKAEAFEVVKAGFRGITQIDRRYDQTYVTVLSPEAALLSAKGSLTATLSDGRTLDSPFAVSLVFVLRDGQWKVLHGHYSKPNP